MSLLCVEVENTHTSVGVFAGSELVASSLLSTDARRTPDEWRLLLSGVLDRLGDPDLDGVCVSSAVPTVLRALRTLIEESPDGALGHPGARALVLGPGVRTGLPVSVDSPRDLGTDRIARAVAAVDVLGAPVVAVGMGTATTFDVVNADGRYVGGAIAAGLAISVAALHRWAAQLRQVELARPRAAIARNTVEAIQSGAVLGHADMVDGMVRRIAAELDARLEELPVVATGVLAPAVIGDCETVTLIEPDLTLQGMRLVFERSA